MLLISQYHEVNISTKYNSKRNAVASFSPEIWPVTWNNMLLHEIGSYKVWVIWPSKRCLFDREFNRDTNDVIKEDNIDEGIGSAPTNTCRDETAALDVY